MPLLGRLLHLPQASSSDIPAVTFSRLLPTTFLNAILLRRTYSAGDFVNMSKKTQYKPTAAADKAPSNWTATRPHKYCGKMDAASPKKKKANKTHLCEACAAIKAQSQRLDTKAMATRREEKMTWMAGDQGWD